MKILMVKSLNNTFSCAYNSDLDSLKKIKPNEMVEVEIKKKRNIMHHRKFFALIDLVYQNQELYTNSENLRNDLTIAAGYYDTRFNFEGVEIIEAKSISFAAMDQTEFNDFYNAVVDTIVKHFHFDKDDIITNVSQYF